MFPGEIRILLLKSALNPLSIPILSRASPSSIFRVALAGFYPASRGGIRTWHPENNGALLVMYPNIKNIQKQTKKYMIVTVTI
jgi:hypothetical protein